MTNLKSIQDFYTSNIMANLNDFLLKNNEKIEEHNKEIRAIENEKHSYSYIINGEGKIEISDNNGSFIEVVDSVEQLNEKLVLLSKEESTKKEKINKHIISLLNENEIINEVISKQNFSFTLSSHGSSVEATFDSDNPKVKKFLQQKSKQLIAEKKVEEKPEVEDTLPEPKEPQVEEPISEEVLDINPIEEELVSEEVVEEILNVNPVEKELVAEETAEENVESNPVLEEQLVEANEIYLPEESILEENIEPVSDFEGNLVEEIAEPAEDNIEEIVLEDFSTDLLDEDDNLETTEEEVLLNEENPLTEETQLIEETPETTNDMEFNDFDSLLDFEQEVSNVEAIEEPIKVEGNNEDLFNNFSFEEEKEEVVEDIPNDIVENTEAVNEELNYEDDLSLDNEDLLSLNEGEEDLLVEENPIEEAATLPTEDEFDDLLGDFNDLDGNIAESQVEDTPEEIVSEEMVEDNLLSDFDDLLDLNEAEETEENVKEGVEGAPLEENGTTIIHNHYYNQSGTPAGDINANIQNLNESEPKETKIDVNINLNEAVSEGLREAEEGLENVEDSVYELDITDDLDFPEVEQEKVQEEIVPTEEVVVEEKVEEPVEESIFQKVSENKEVVHNSTENITKFLGELKGKDVMIDTFSPKQFLLKKETFLDKYTQREKIIGLVLIGIVVASLAILAVMFGVMSSAQSDASKKNQELLNAQNQIANIKKEQEAAQKEADKQKAIQEHNSKMIAGSSAEAFSLGMIEKIKLEAIEDPNIKVDVMNNKYLLIRFSSLKPQVGQKLTITFNNGKQPLNYIVSKSMTGLADGYSGIIEVIEKEAQGSSNKHFIIITDSNNNFFRANP